LIKLFDISSYGIIVLLLIGSMLAAYWRWKQQKDKTQETVNNRLFNAG